MILADTSIWIDHLRATDPQLTDLLETGGILTHPYVIGEIALGNLPNRDIVLHSLQLLPKATTASDDEVLHFIRHTTLFGTGIGYIDAHLLASVRLTSTCSLWTRDKQLRKSAEALKLAAPLP